MKTIGIKLADGSFYPVLEEGSPKKKNLNLTTAHNNQTKVMVDLYRSASCSMDDAEYVDSLQIENLNAHPTGEADIAFTVAIDEDNKLSANIIDEETGKESETNITLVSRTIEERLITDDYKISDGKEKKAAKVAGGLLAGGGLLAAASAIRKKQEEKSAADETVEITENEEPIIDEQSVSEEEAEFTDFNLGDPDPTGTELTFEDAAEEPALPEEPVIEETPVEEAPADTENFVSDDLPDFNFDETESSETVEDNPFEDEAPALEDTTAAADETLVNDDLPDFNFDETESTEAVEDNPFEDEAPALEDTTAAADETLVSDDLPDFNFDDFDTTENSDISENSGFMSDTTSDTDLTEDSLPDFNFDGETSSTSDEIEETTADSYELPDFGEISSFDSDESDADNLFDDSDLNFDTNDDIPVSGGGISFTGLYDKETELGESASYETEETSKKTRVPVIICIICAIICVIATLLILFIIPSKYNLINKKTKTEQTAVVQPEEIIEEPVPEIILEPEPEPVPEAKEDEIVIIEEAEIVVPAQPPVVEEKPADITYKIKWGDTLWDISNTYYKNPWRYKYIAKYNNIKDPDYIISGRYITIPAE